MIDMAGALTTYLRTNTNLMTLTGSKVYCDELPEGVTAPYVLLRTVNVTPAAPPTLAYDRYVIQTDCYAPAGAYTTAASIADSVRTLLHQAAGVRGAARVASVIVTTSDIGVDATHSPAIPRWVLTVDVTGRSN